MRDDRFLGIWTSKRDALAGVAALAAGLVLVALGGRACGFGLPGGDAFVEDGPCRDELGKPLKARDVVTAFRAEGFSVSSLDMSFYCEPSHSDGETAIADVSNQEGPVDGADEREGWATCHVYRDGGAPPYRLDADLEVGPDSPIFSGTKAQFSLANVNCSLYPSYEGNAGRAQVRKAHEAMKRLERRLASAAG